MEDITVPWSSISTPRTDWVRRGEGLGLCPSSTILW